MKNISIIVAIAEDFGIGYQNELLCHIPGDLPRFKSITSGHSVIMGRNTYLSLPNGPLRNRTNIVMSDNPGDAFAGCLMASSIEDAVAKAGEDEKFIIGGAMVYSQFLPLASKLYLTRVHHTFRADAFFPKIDFTEWQLVESQDVETDDNCDFDFTYETYLRTVKPEQPGSVNDHL